MYARSRLGAARLWSVVAVALLSASTLSACGADKASSATASDEGSTTLTGTLVVRQWACIGDSAESAGTRLDRVMKGATGNNDSETTMALTNTIMELGDAQLDGTPVSNHSSEQLAPAEEIDDSGTTEPCDNAGELFGYEDLGDGTQVDITDGAGKTLGLAELDNGRITMKGTFWDFTTEVPQSEFYEIAVADRGSVKISGDAAADPILLQLR